MLFHFLLLKLIIKRAIKLIQTNDVYKHENVYLKKTNSICSFFCALIFSLIYIYKRLDSTFRSSDLKWALRGIFLPCILDRELKHSHKHIEGTALLFENREEGFPDCM